MTLNTKAAQDATAESAAAVNAALQQFVNRANIGTKTIVKKYGAVLMRTLALVWPVRTGQSRAGWAAGSSVIGVTMPPKGKSAVAQALGRLQGSGSLRESQEKIEFTATNGVQHSTFVDAGVSPQAAAGIVSRSLRQLETQIVAELRQLPAKAAK